MPDWAQIISDALDILKFDGAVQDTLGGTAKEMGAQSRRCWMNALMPLAFSI